MIDNLPRFSVRLAASTEVGIKLQQGKITRCLNTYHELRKVGYLTPAVTVAIQKEIDSAASLCLETALSFEVETTEDVKQLLSVSYLLKPSLFNSKSQWNRALRLAYFGKSE